MTGRPADAKPTRLATVLAAVAEPLLTTRRVARFLLRHDSSLAVAAASRASIAEVGHEGLAARRFVPAGRVRHLARQRRAATVGRGAGGRSVLTPGLSLDSGRGKRHGHARQM